MHSTVQVLCRRPSLPTVSLTNARLTFDEAGGGEDVLVLIHGHPFDRSMWRPQLRSVSEAGWKVIAPDLRGYGESSTTSGKVTLECFATDIIELLDLLDCNRVVFGGLSMGGQIAMELCRLVPERVAGLLLAATFARTETEEGKAKRYETAARIEREGMSGYAHQLLPQMLAPETLRQMPELAASVLAMMLRAPASGAAAALRGRAEHPSYCDALRRIDAPALIVAGDRDSYTTQADAEELQHLLHSSELQWLPGVGHMPNLERIETFNSALLNLLCRASSRQRKVLV